MVKTPRNVPEPTKLVSNRIKWTLRYQRILSAGMGGDWATRDAKHVLSVALRQLAHGKCAFCESPLEVSGDLEIEHYTAKTVKPELAFEWTNLLPSCRLCNRSKGNLDHGDLLLKPDVEDPEPFFWIHPDTGKLEPHPRLDLADEQRALRTIEICSLQRPALCTKRAEMLSRVGRFLEFLATTVEATSAVMDEWEFLSHPSTEYKFVVRHLLRLRGYHPLSMHDKARFETPIRP
jgi:uncharacterized protein (TIGR02646 family)